jgi:hypothetical protein
MASINNLSALINTLQDISERHYQVNSFVCAPTWDYNNITTLKYPVVHINPLEGTYVKSASDNYNVKEIVLQIRVLDLVNKSLNNRNNVNSDTEQILSDFVNELNENPYYQDSDLMLVGDINTEWIDQTGEEEANGILGNFRFKLRNNTAFCGLPISPLNGDSYPGYVFSGITSVNYLTCNTLTACTSFQNYVQNEIDKNLTGGTISGDYLPLSGGTVTGNTIFTLDLSASTLYSGSTNLYDIFLTENDGNDITRLQDGLNTYTGGTDNNPTVNVSGLTIDNITVSGNSIFNSLSASTLYSGSTELTSIFNNKYVTLDTVQTIVNSKTIETGSNSDTFTVNHTSGSGKALVINKSDSNEGLIVNKISGSGNAVTITGGRLQVIELLGGTGTTSKLTYTASSNASPTATAVAHEWMVGNNGATTAYKTYHNGNVNIGNATNTSQRILRIGQDTAFVDIGSWVDVTSRAAIYLNQETPSFSNYTLSGARGFPTNLNAEGGQDLRFNIGGVVQGRWDTTGLYIGGSNAASAKLHVVRTSEQLRVGYNASNYYTTTVGSTGTVTLDAVGSGANFVFLDNIELTQTVHSVSPTSPNRTIQIVINGTTYYLHAKTTND